MHINSHAKFQLGFSKFQFSTVRTVKRMELHHYTKFRRNRLNCGRDMVIIRFFKMAAAAILDLKTSQLQMCINYHRILL